MRVLVARAGALGDLVLLRRTIAPLVSAGHRASLLAPAVPAAALVGPGEVSVAFPWDGPEMAAVLSGETTGGPVEAALVSADAVVAFTRSAGVLEALGRQAAPAERADDAGCDRLPDPERVADRDHVVADLQGVGIADANRGQALGLDLEHGDIGAGVGAHELRRELAPVLEGDEDLLGVADHVVVRDDVTARRIHYHSRARGLLLPLRAVGQVEEAAEERIRE